MLSTVHIRSLAFFIGAGNGVRTRDPQLGKLMLYQLSYSRNFAQIVYVRVGGLSILLESLAASSSDRKTRCKWLFHRNSIR